MKDYSTDGHRKVADHHSVGVRNFVVAVVVVVAGTAHLVAVGRVVLALGFGLLGVVLVVIVMAVVVAAVSVVASA